VANGPWSSASSVLYVLRTTLTGTHALLAGEIEVLDLAAASSDGDPHGLKTAKPRRLLSRRGL
jgi:hypothetical protein